MTTILKLNGFFFLRFPIRFFFAISNFAKIEEITPGGAGTGTLLDRDKL